MNTGDIIKQLRLQANMSQQELAMKSGYSDRSSIAKIESGKVDLPESKIKLFSEIFHVTPADIMGLRVSNSLSISIAHNPLTPDETELLEDYRSLSKPGKEYIRQTMVMAKLSYSEKNVSVSDMETAK